MEIVSKGRGRPRTFDDGELTSVAETMGNGVLTSGLKSRRQMQNRLYALRALERLRLLGDDQLAPTLADRPALRWLVDEEGARWGILTELGRIRDPEQFDVAVEWLLARRPKTREAVTRIRRFRTGRIEAPDARQLAEDIIRTVNGYGLVHPSLTREQELEALRLATEVIADGRHLGSSAAESITITKSVNCP